MIPSDCRGGGCTSSLSQHTALDVILGEASRAFPLLRRVIDAYLDEVIGLLSAQRLDEAAARLDLALAVISELRGEVEVS